MALNKDLRHAKQFTKHQTERGVPSKRRTGESKMITKARKLDILYGAA